MITRTAALLAAFTAVTGLYALRHAPTVAAQAPAVVVVTPTNLFTAVGFDLPGTNRGTFTLTGSTASGFTLVSGVKVQAGAQTQSENFDFALLTGNNFGGGSVAAGIAPGQSATFTVTGNFSGLTAQSGSRSSSSCASRGSGRST